LTSASSISEARILKE